VNKYKENFKMGQNRKISSNELGADRAGLVCCWVFRWEWSNASNIARVAGVKRLRYADELVARGFLIRLDSGPGRMDRFVYILSDLGRQFAAYELDQFGDSLPPLAHYTLTDHQRVSLSVHEHHMVAQEIVLRLAGDQLHNFPQWTTELEERRKVDDAVSADAIDTFSRVIRLNQSDLQWFIRLHEVEMNQKTNARLRHWLGLRIQRLQEYGEGRACCFVWAASNAIIQRYTEVLSKPIPRYYCAVTGKLTVDQSKPPLQAEPWMFRFFKLERDRVSGVWHPSDQDLASLIG
jgi:hypothetical protein